MKLTLNLSLLLLSASMANAATIVEFDGECNYTNLKEASGLNEDDLISLLTGGGTDQAAAETATDAACLDAQSRYSNPRKTAFDFRDINGEQWQFDTNFYDGGTYHNEEYEPVAIDQTFDNIYNDVAQDNLITYPDTSRTASKNFANCEINTVMCCWSQDRQANDGNGNCADNDCDDADPADNTDICYVDMANSPGSAHVAGGFSIFPAETEGDAHCHGFAWNDDPTGTDYRYRGNNLFYISYYDHLSERGYAREIPGAPMCACIEQMPVVSRSDCTEMEITETYSFKLRRSGVTTARIIDSEIAFNACRDADGNADGNDLEDYLRYLKVDESVFRPYLVGQADANNGDDPNCQTAIDSFLEEKL